VENSKHDNFLTRMARQYEDEAGTKYLKELDELNKYFEPTKSLDAVIARRRKKWYMQPYSIAASILVIAMAVTYSLVVWTGDNMGSVNFDAEYAAENAPSGTIASPQVTPEAAPSMSAPAPSAAPAGGNSATDWAAAETEATSEDDGFNLESSAATGAPPSMRTALQTPPPGWEAYDVCTTEHAISFRLHATYSSDAVVSVTISDEYEHKTYDKDDNEYAIMFFNLTSGAQVTLATPTEHNHHLPYIAQHLQANWR